MHQEQLEVFSVSVGNLPANCEVIINITYVGELPIENNDIIFRLPAKVTSWQSKEALQSKEQTLLPSIDLLGENESMKSVLFSLKASIRMPYEILKVFSPAHEDSQACMLTFYPKFDMETSATDYVQVIFIIDVSNSIDGKHVQQAKRLPHLFFTSLKPEEANLYFNIVTFGSDND